MIELLKSNKNIILPLIVLIILAGLGGKVYFMYKLGDNRGYAPTQPIPFSHKIHAGDNQIPCMYCHSNVDKSRHATIPPLNVCMNCHRVVKTDSPYIQKIHKHYQENKPIEWVKVHDLPDHVFFNHKRHIKKGVACSACHGPVETMDKVEQKKILNMGYCVKCHRKNNAPLNCYTCHQ